MYLRLSVWICGLLEKTLVIGFKCTKQHTMPGALLAWRYLLHLLFRCPAGKVEVTDNLTGLRHCTSSPCGHWTCRNGGTCIVQTQDKTICKCPEGYKGRWCEISQVKAGRPVGLSSGSILAISMCLLVFLGRKASTFFSFFLILYLAPLNQACFTLGCCDQCFTFSGDHQLGNHLRRLRDRRQHIVTVYLLLRRFKKI